MVANMLEIHYANYIDGIMALRTVESFKNDFEINFLFCFQFIFVASILFNSNVTYNGQ